MCLDDIDWSQPHLLPQTVFDCEFIICFESSERFQQLDLLFHQQLINGSEVLQPGRTIRDAERNIHPSI